MTPSPDPTPAVRARQLGWRVRAEWVLDGIDLDVHAGEAVGLIGPNGAGKSTLLLLVAGLLRPTRGTVEVLGRASHRTAVDATGAVGLITARPGLYALLSGRENLHHFGGLYGLSRAEVDGRIDSHVQSLQLDAAIDRRVGTYSSGMQQKVSLLRALLMQPQVLLLDEPTANLDPVAAHTLLGLVRDLVDRGLAVIMATHDLGAVECMCERAVVLRTRVLDTRTFSGPRTPPPVGELFAPYRDALTSAGPEKPT